MMKPVFTLLAFFIYITLFASCNKTKEMTDMATNIPATNSAKLKITIGSNTFNATVYSNATVTAFKKRLPMTIKMKELNSNEKYFDSPADLPSNASNPGTIQSGDLMLYGSRTLVLFYQSFSTSYTYTKLGRIDNPAGLAAALGSGNPTVKFEVE